jgi:hypothetical protein
MSETGIAPSPPGSPLPPFVQARHLAMTIPGGSRHD